MRVVEVLLLTLCVLYPVFLNSQEGVPIQEDKETPPVLQEAMPYAPEIQRQGQEWRALWVDAWNKGVMNQEQVKEVVQIASTYGYNAIAVQIRRRGDALYFPTYPNTEPRMPGLAADFDPLYEFIRQGHLAGLEVHAWITTFLISTATPPAAPEHVFHKHPEYLTENFAGEKNIAEGYYLDPGHPDALEWNSRVVMDLVSRYDIDGIHFDYVRYPQQSAGYNATALSRYNKEFGLSGRPASDDANFSNWRRRQITDWIRKMYVKIIEQKPLMKVTAATFAGRSDAYQNRFQDWAEWMNQGILDGHFPMNYATSLTTFQSRVDDSLQHSYGRHVYMGIGAYLLGVDSTITQLQYARKQKAPGMILFSYANNNKGGDWQTTYAKIRDTVFPTTAVVPEMLWKNATVGHLHGQVIDKSTNTPLTNARMVIPELRKLVKTDGLGWFSFAGITPGQYTLQCQHPNYRLAQTTVNVPARQVVTQTITAETGTPAQLILDTDDALFTANWTIGVSAVDKYGSNYRFIGPGTGSQEATFAIPKDIRGNYSVYTWYSAGTNRTPGVSYLIAHAGGTTKVVVNQQKNAGTWHLLGTWEFTPSQTCTVSITDAMQGGEVVIVDAVKLEKP